LEYEYKGENVWQRVCQGGTHASSFIEYVNKNKAKKHWTCAITLTDGYIESEPIPSNLPMLWVITSGGSTEFKHKSPKIKMN
jgi:predicted metal-dependent peptidase